jgi:hypothetical protein
MNQRCVLVVRTGERHLVSDSDAGDDTAIPRIGLHEREDIRV